MSTLPTWAVYAVSFGTPIAAFLGVLIGHLVTRKGATELERWRRREETMRMLRWAAEQAVEDGKAGVIGIAALDALSTSELLQEEDQDFIDAVTDAVLEDAVEAYSDSVGEPRVVEQGPGS